MISLSSNFSPTSTEWISPLANEQHLSDFIGFLLYGIAEEPIWSWNLLFSKNFTRFYRPVRKAPSFLQTPAEVADLCKSSPQQRQCNSMRISDVNPEERKCWMSFHKEEKVFDNFMNINYLWKVKIYENILEGDFWPVVWNRSAQWYRIALRIQPWQSQARPIFRPESIF